MSEFRVLSKPEIRKWLNGIIGSASENGKPTTRPTIWSLAKHMGIKSNTLEWLARKDTARLSVHAQMHFSKVIAQIENGLLEFERQGQKKVAVLRDKPRPLLRYKPVFGRQGPTLRMVDRPAPYRPMPTFKGLLGK